MESSAHEVQPEVKKIDGCFERTFAALSVDDIYEIAKYIGSEVEKLIDRYGKESAVGLVPKIVKVLELLESFASRNHAHKLREEELLKDFEKLQIQQQKKRAVKESEDVTTNNEIREAREKEEQWRRRCEELQGHIQQLQEDNKELQNRLRGNHAQEDRVQRQEREVMLKLKEVVDKQRDELRAKVQEIASATKEVEALQEQLERFMKMNGELRHKQSVIQSQVKNAVERKADMEADLREKQKEIQRLAEQLEKAKSLNAGVSGPASSKLDLSDKMVIDLRDPNRPCFTKQEVREILSERNELKANLFLVQEELAYYQREILNDERCPGFLLEAVRSTIKKQRTVIKAKMLGIPVDNCSSEEEGGKEEETETDSAEVKPAESRIRNLFGFLTRSGSSSSTGPSPTHIPNATSSWEIIVPDDIQNSSETELRRSP